jgi:hypothetical protein
MYGICDFKIAFSFKTAQDLTVQVLAVVTVEFKYIIVNINKIMTNSPKKINNFVFVMEK